MVKPKNKIQYLRRVSQILFFALFVFLGTGTVCSLLLPGYNFIMCPLGALQVTLSSTTLSTLIIISALALIVATILFGAAFCSWVCPIGLILEFIDTAIDKLKLPQLFEKHNSKAAELLKNKFVAYGILGSTLVGSGVLRNPVFCVFCPIGTACRGVAQGGCIVSSGIEMAIIPAVGALSLGEKRFWCKYLCPIGAFLSLISKVNVLIKPVVNEIKCIDLRIHRRICPNWKNFKGKDASDWPPGCNLCDSCASCDICKKTCPAGLNFADNAITDSNCTKCLECYIKCPRNAIQIKLTKNKNTNKQGSDITKNA